MDKLLIYKKGLNFWHRRNDLPLSDRNISDFEVGIEEDFVIVELDGSQNWKYKVENVSIKVDLGAIENFTDRFVLLDRLKEINYTPYSKSFEIFGDLYIEKEEKSQSVTTVAQTGSINLPIRNKCSMISIEGTITEITGVDFSGAGLYFGKKYTFYNNTNANVNFKHLGSSVVKFFFPNLVDFILKPNETIEFIYKVEAGSNKLYYVGAIQNTANSTKVYKNINSNTLIDNSFHEATVYVLLTCNITIPSGLRTDFNCNFKTFTGAIGNFLTQGTVINTESDGDVLNEKSMCHLSVFSTNNYILTGGGLN